MNVGSGHDGRCQIVGGEKLPPHVGGGTTLCAEIERAVASAAPRARYTAEVKVLSKSKLAATLVVNGRTLPEQRFAIMDSDLDTGAIQRFARSLAAEVAKAAKP
jgi:hypothetical protein